MAVYKNTNKTSTLTAVEFTPVSDGNFTFFYVDNPRTPREDIKKWITSPEVGQKIVAETVVNNHPVFITHGDKTKDDMMKLLEARGDKLELKTPDRKINMWKWRGILSMTGHPMQLAASMMGPKGFNFGVGLFAILNLAANLTNIFFGAERSPDPHRLRFIKNEINDDLGEHVGTLDELLHVDDKRADLRKGPEQPQSIWGKFNNFMKRNSVTLGEIGLRYLGGISLVSPIDQWKEGIKELFKTGSAKKFLNNDKFIAVAGSLWLGGKTIAFFSKVPDPYNPEPSSTWDTIREKYLFKISTLTEMAGAGTLAGRRFLKGTIKWPNKGFIPSGLRGKETTDYLGGVGGMLFMAAFGMRLSAPYGVKEVNMEEVYAHATDTLAKTPPEKLPQLMAESAATLKEHFKDKDVEFGEIYNKMMRDMYRYHHIALDNLGTEPEERRTEQAQANKAPPQAAAAKPALVAQRTPLDRATAPAANHSEAAKAATKETPLGIGA